MDDLTPTLAEERPCSSCGAVDFYYYKRKDGREIRNCRPCGARHAAARRERVPEDQLRFNAMGRSRKGGTLCTLTSADIREMFEQQDNKCAYCEKPLSTSAKSQFSASLDQVIPGAGYTRENSVLACVRCNRRKSDLTPNDMRDLAARVEHVLATMEARRQAGSGNVSG